jgi:hypothetical protein
MKTILLASAATIALTASAFAAEINGEVTLDAAKSGDDYTVTSGVELGIFGEMGMGSITIAVDENDGLVLDKWAVGAMAGEFELTFGDQGDLMDAFEGQTKFVGGQTLANLDDDYVSARATARGVSVAIGFEDIKSDVTDIKNVQISYSTVIGTFDVATAIDFNIVTDDYTIAGFASTEISGIETSATVTFSDDVVGYEVSAGYGMFKGFLNGDQDDLAQNIGGGAYHTMKNGMEVYAEASYNLDSQEITPAVGLAFKF